MKNIWADLTIFLIMSSAILIVIFGRSFTDADGFLSPDSTNYLRLAQRILDGHTFSVPNSGREPAMDTHFAIWPIGYPTLIAVFSFFTQSNVFIASKILNASMLICLLVVLRREFSFNGYVIGAILLTAGTLQIFAFTWSETSFIFFLFLLCIQLGKILDRDENLSLGSAMYLTALLISIFLSRYIGIFAAPTTALISLFLFQRNRAMDGMKVFCAALFSFLLSIGYLVLNKHLTGHTTGMERIPAPENPYMLLRDLSVTIVRELILPLPAWNTNSTKENIIAIVFIFMIATILVRVVKSQKYQVQRGEKDKSLVFFLFGTSYLATIIAARFSSQFDGFSYRLIDPAFAMIFVGLLLYSLAAYKDARRDISIFLLAASTLSVVGHAYSMLQHTREVNYFSASAERREQYSTIPDGAIVLFGDTHLAYLRPNVHIARPKSTPYSSADEPIEEFISTLDTSRSIYLETGRRALNQNNYHSSVKDWLLQFPPNSIVKLQDKKPGLDG